MPEELKPVVILAGDKGQEPLDDDEDDVEGRTPAEKTEAQPAAPAAAPAATDPADKSDSAKARELGEDRKALIDTMLRDAEVSETAKAAFLKVLEERPSLKKVAEEKFADRINKLRGVTATQGEQKTTEELKMTARAEVYLEMEQAEEKEMTTQLAAKIGMNAEEAERLTRLTRAYAKEAGVDFRTALYKMARAEKPDHVAVLTMPSSTTPSIQKEENAITEQDRADARVMGRDAKWVAQQRVRAEKGATSGGAFQIDLK